MSVGSWLPQRTSNLGPWRLNGPYLPLPAVPEIKAELLIHAAQPSGPAAPPAVARAAQDFPRVGGVPGPPAPTVQVPSLLASQIGKWAFAEGLPLVPGDRE